MLAKSLSERLVRHVGSRLVLVCPRFIRSSRWQIPCRALVTVGRDHLFQNRVEKSAELFQGIGADFSLKGFIFIPHTHRA